MWYNYNMELNKIENLLEFLKLKKIDTLLISTARMPCDNTYYFVNNNFILLIQPYRAINVENPSIGFCDSYYLAFQKLYAIKISVKEKLIENGIICYDFKGQYKKLAVSIGIGKILRNTLVWLPNIGTFFALEVISFKESYEEVSPILFKMDKFCLHCQKCIKACPTGALTESGFIRENCIRQWQCDFLYPCNNEDRKRKLENKILGCNICQRCCPQNSSLLRAGNTISQDYKHFFNLDILAKNCIIKSTERSFYNKYLGKNYMRPRRILSFALNAMENDLSNLYQHYCTIRQYENTVQDKYIRTLIRYYKIKWENANDFN